MSISDTSVVSEAQITQFEGDGAIMLPGLFDQSWVNRLRNATERAIVNSTAIKAGGFTRNRNMWLEDEDFRAFIFESPASDIARSLLRSSEVRFYYDHLFVKEPGTEEATPWHQDRPYWPVAGGEVISIWLALDEVTQESSGLVYVKGSHRAGKIYRPVGFSDGKVANESYATDIMPDISGRPDDFTLLSWDMQPGDCLVHHSLAIHGASGNTSASRRRRALSTRWAGTDVLFDPRPGSDRLLAGADEVPGRPLSSDMYPLFR